jgi:hypothetical protein
LANCWQDSIIRQDSKHPVDGRNFSG